VYRQAKVERVFVPSDAFFNLLENAQKLNNLGISPDRRAYVVAAMREFAIGQGKEQTGEKFPASSDAESFIHP
jgi:hypothetical protein